MTVVPGPHKNSFSDPFLRRTMASLTESPQVALVSRSKHPASSPFSLSRRVLPVLCVAIGLSVGFATGFTLALVNAPNDTVAASGDANQAGPVPLTANFSQPASATGHFVANPAAVKAHAPTAVQIARNKIPDAVKPAMFKLGGKEWRVAMPIAIPVSQPVRQGLASTPAADSTAVRARRG
jgi:hypothetical protein